MSRKLSELQTKVSHVPATDYLVGYREGDSLGARWTGAQVIAPHNAAPNAHLNIVRRTLAGNLVLTAADLPQQKIIPDADRDVTLPAEGATQWLFEICHGGTAYVVTVKRASGTVVASLIAGSPITVSWDGVAFGFC